MLQEIMVDYALPQANHGRLSLYRLVDLTEFWRPLMRTWLRQRCTERMPAEWSVALAEGDIEASYVTKVYFSTAHILHD